MSQIFISYARVDKARVEPLIMALERRGWSVFWDGDIEPAENWHHSIATKLEAAACTITLWTGSSVRSYWVIEETMYSTRRGVLLPALLDDISPPPGFLTLQCADLTSWDGSEEHPAFLQLEDAITKLAGSPENQPNTEYPVPTPPPPAKQPDSVVSRPHVYEGESMPWFNWSILFFTFHYFLFGERINKYFESVFEGSIDGSVFRLLIPTLFVALSALNFKAMIWDAKRYNSKEITAIFVLSSFALYYLCGLVTTAAKFNLGSLEPAKSGQLIASILVLGLTIAVWLARSYQKSWLEATYLWLLGCLSSQAIAINTALLFYHGSATGFGRINPWTTGVLIGSILLVLSAATLIAVKFRYMARNELAFYWFFGSVGLTAATRILFVAYFGRQYEIDNLSGTKLGLALSMVIGVLLLVLWFWRERRITHQPTMQ